jgi:hypothetical protein
VKSPALRGNRRIWRLFGADATIAAQAGTSCSLSLAGALVRDLPRLTGR